MPQTIFVTISEVECLSGEEQGNQGEQNVFQEDACSANGAVVLNMRTWRRSN